MSATRCKVCALAASHPSLYRKIQDTLAAAREGVKGAGIPACRNLAHAEGVEIGERDLQKHDGRKKGDIACPPIVPADKAAEALLKGANMLEIDADGNGKITTEETFADVIDWDSLLRELRVDPATTRVKPGSVKATSRQVLTKNADGEMVKRTATTYTAVLEPRDLVAEQAYNLTREIVAGAVARWTAPGVTVAKAPEKQGDASMLLAISDLQIGQNGPSEVLINAGVSGTLATAHGLINALDVAFEKFHRENEFRHPNSITVVLPGDNTEGSRTAGGGFYPNMNSTVTLSPVDQIAVAGDLLTYVIGRVRAEFGLPVRVLVANSNHGEMSHSHEGDSFGNHNTTDRLLARQIAREFALTDGPAVTVDDPKCDLMTVHDINGVKVALAHGHRIGNRQKTNDFHALNFAYDEQMTVNNGGQPVLVDVFLYGHIHTFVYLDHGRYIEIGVPALDNGSAYFKDATGKYSRRGIVAGYIDPASVAKAVSVEPIFVDQRDMLAIHRDLTKRERDMVTQINELVVLNQNVK